MSQQNVEIVRNAFEAMATRGLDAWIEFLTDDVDHRAIEGAPDDRGLIHGKEDVRAYLQEWFEMFDDFKVEPLELLDAGEDKVIVVVRFGGRARLSGVETDQTAAVVYTIRDRKIARGREYATHERALEAAGLSE